MTDTMAGDVVIPRSLFDACMCMAKEYAPLSIAPHLSKALAAQPSAGAQGDEHVCEWRLIAETQDAQYARVTAMIDAAREAGWAMMEVVDGIAWEKRQQFSDIAARLAKRIEAVEGQAPIATPAQPDTGAVEALREAVQRFDEALDDLPPFKERVLAGQQFNAYSLADDDGMSAVCLGPITSKPLTVTEASHDLALLIEAAFRVALKSRAALSTANTQGAK